MNRRFKGTTYNGVYSNIKDTEDLMLEYNSVLDFDEKEIITSIEKVLYKEIMQYIKINPLYQKYKNMCILDIILIQKYNQNIGKYVYHVDDLTNIDVSLFDITKKALQQNQSLENDNKDKIRRRILTFIFYLNDVDEGGETEFFQMHRVRPRKGGVVIFPASDFYLHKGCVPTSCDKYILTGWLYSS